MTNRKYVICFTSEYDETNHINNLLLGIVTTYGGKNIYFIDFESFYSFPDDTYK